MSNPAVNIFVGKINNKVIFWLVRNPISATSISKIEFTVNILIHFLKRFELELGFKIEFKLALFFFTSILPHLYFCDGYIA